MKTLDIKELQKLDMKKLLEQLETAKKELFKIKFEVRNNQSKSNHLISRYRKYVAQVKTIMNNKAPESVEAPKEEVTKTKQS